VGHRQLTLVVVAPAAIRLLQLELVELEVVEMAVLVATDLTELQTLAVVVVDLEGVDPPDILEETVVMVFV